MLEKLVLDRTCNKLSDRPGAIEMACGIDLDSTELLPRDDSGSVVGILHQFPDRFGIGFIDQVEEAPAGAPCELLESEVG